MRQDSIVKGVLQVEEALPIKHQYAGRNKKKKNYKKNQASSWENTATSHNQSKDGSSKGNYPPCQHCGKKGHPPFKCWRRPDAKCSKCNQLGHEAVICKSKSQNQDANAQHMIWATTEEKKGSADQELLEAVRLTMIKALEKGWRRMQVEIGNRQ
ncbi:hypothetical protein ACH5RR_037567 [Cinchona calisaya]|uniref:Uncharacterized protein n=1 Tax=Cinchona calisaya TaxID=153742 RepID=A0ABD2YC22_9GENT